VKQDGHDGEGDPSKRIANEAARNAGCRGLYLVGRAMGIQSSEPLRYAMVDGRNVRDSRVHNTRLTRLTRLGGMPRPARNCWSSGAILASDDCIRWLGD
jgi:hypothetical protein